MNHFNTTVKNDSIFNTLLSHAETVTDCRDHRHAAATVYKKKILAIGKNQMKTHPIMLQYQTDSTKIYLHAEIDAIVKVINVHGADILKHCSLYNLRLTGGGNVAMSKPCKGCQKAIDAFGIKKVFWT